jgi:hypothetical protein
MAIPQALIQMLMGGAQQQPAPGSEYHPPFGVIPFNPNSSPGQRGQLGMPLSNQLGGMQYGQPAQTQPFMQPPHQNLQSPVQDPGGSQPDLQKVLDQLTQAGEYQKKAVAGTKAKKMGTAPRPGASALALLADLLLHGNGQIANSFMGGFANSRNEYNQGQQEDADRQAQMTQVDAETAKQKASVYQADYQNKVADQRAAAREAAAADRTLKTQQAGLDKTALIQKGTDDRNAIKTYNDAVYAARKDYNGKYPPHMIQDMADARKALIEQGINPALLQPAYEGQTTKGGQVEIDNAVKKAQLNEITDKMSPRNRNILSQIEARKAAATQAITKFKADDANRKAQLKIQQQVANTGSFNAQTNRMRATDAGKKNQPNIYAPSKAEEKLGIHVRNLSEASAALAENINLMEQQGLNQPDNVSYPAYQKALRDKAENDAALTEAKDWIPKYQGPAPKPMTRAEWITYANRAMKDGKHDPAQVTKILNDALRHIANK